MLAKRDKAPRFTLEDLDGRRVSLDELLARGPAVVALFKISCPVCQLALPFLERIARGGTLPVIAISQDDAQSTRKFCRGFSLSMPALLDREEEGYVVSNAFGITRVPSIFVVETDGVISFSGDGFSKADLAAMGARAGVEVFRQEDNVPEWKAG